MSERTVEELEGAYRLLCEAMLTHTARMLAQFRARRCRAAVSSAAAYRRSGP